MITDSDACKSVARIHPWQHRAAWMERHFRHIQVFMPLNDEPFALVVAPPNDRKVPDPESVRAFRLPRNQLKQLTIQNA